jgi:hypothetical protein
VISVSEVEEIIYEDGTWEKFDKPRTETEPEETEEPSRPGPPRPTVKKNDDPILQSGFFFEGILGAAFRQGRYIEYNSYYDQFGNWITTEVEQERTDTYMSLNIRLGSKWYFGASDKWRPGLQVNYFRFGILIDPNAFESLIIGPKNFTICNVGMANAFKFNENIGMEVNVNGGYNLEMYPDDGTVTHGIAANGDVKFRFRRLAVGIDYTRIFGFSVDNFGGGSTTDRAANYHIVGLSIGAKF